ncbi:hypothetical protein Fmac_005360 [Flemingia macrophylla]|uniref:RING-type domain-containing protein n=1 Tax=Flemingia macrophylla TaxID=520843 RepID=A0ABD1NA70_9FABA
MAPSNCSTDDHEQEQTEDEVGACCFLLNFCFFGIADLYILLDLASIRQEFQCAICLGIIRKTRTVMECLHRFCRECIDKAIRLGKNECPTCRAHCASRRSLRDDPNYDALISAIYPDIDKYEAEEFAWCEAEIKRNKQIQDSIAQTVKRQAEAASSKRQKARATAAAQGNNGTSDELQQSNDNENMNDNDGGKDLSTGDDTKTMLEEGGERDIQFPHEPLAMDVDQTDDEITPSMVSLPGSIYREENDDQSNTEVNGGNARSIRIFRLINHLCNSESDNDDQSNTEVNEGSARNSRITRLINHLRNSEADEVEMEIPLKLVSLDEQKIPNMQRPIISCKPSMPMKTLCKYVALTTEVQAEEVQLYLVEEPQTYIQGGEKSVDDINKDKLRVLEDEETLGELYTPTLISLGPMILAYKMKQQNLAPCLVGVGGEKKGKSPREKGGGRLSPSRVKVGGGQLSLSPYRAGWGVGEEGKITRGRGTIVVARGGV